MRAFTEVGQLNFNVQMMDYVSFETARLYISVLSFTCSYTNSVIIQERLVHYMAEAAPYPKTPPELYNSMAWNFISRNLLWQRCLRGIRVWAV